MIWLWIWGIVTALALVFEFITADLITIWFAAGGLVTLLVVALAPNLPWVCQLVIFVGVSALLLVCTRKICLKLLRNDDTKTAPTTIIGSKIRIDEVKNNHSYKKINGIFWKLCADEGEVLEVGEEYEVYKILGNKLIVKKVDKNRE